VFLARTGASKEQIRREIATRVGYDLDRTVDAIRPAYTFDVAAERSVPEALICFLDAPDFEGAVRNAISLGGDADTMACIAGAIAEAHWGEVPEPIAPKCASACRGNCSKSWIASTLVSAASAACERRGRR
jgi:ADP-ribosylglycohydrolase